MKGKKKKGFTVGNLGSVALAFVVVVIVIGVGATILSQLQATQTSGTVAYNTTGYGLTSLSTMGQWLPLLALVIIATLIIAVVVRSFGGGGGAGV